MSEDNIITIMKFMICGICLLFLGWLFLGFITFVNTNTNNIEEEVKRNPLEYSHEKCNEAGGIFFSNTYPHCLKIEGATKVESK